MPYQFILEDLAGTARSELAGATAKQFTRAILSMSTANVTVPLWHEQADFMLEGDALLKVVDVQRSSRTNVFHGRLVAAEEVGDASGGSVKATFADGFWTLLRRLCGRSPAGYTMGTALAPVAATAIISDIVDTANAESPTGLRLGSVTPSPATVYTGPHYYRPRGEVIAQLSAVLDGPDWRVDPIDAVASSDPARCTYGELVLAPALATVRLDKAFEYGDGKLNVRSYQRGVSLDGTANRVYHLPTGFPDQTTQAVLTSNDASSQAKRGLLESVVAADITPDQMRQALLDHHIAIRRNARQTITFQPVNDLSTDRLPRLRTDYDVGDIVPFRASVRRGQVLDKRIDVLARIYQVQVDVDPQSGAGQPSLTITPTS